MQEWIGRRFLSRHLNGVSARSSFSLKRMPSGFGVADLRERLLVVRFVLSPPSDVTVVPSGQVERGCWYLRPWVSLGEQAGGFELGQHGVDLRDDGRRVGGCGELRFGRLLLVTPPRRRSARRRG